MNLRDLLQAGRVVLAILAIYLEWSFPLTAEIFVPHFFALLLALTLLPRVWQWRRLAAAMAAFGAFCAFNLFTTTMGGVPLGRRLRSVIYFGYLFAIALTICLTWRFEGWQRRAAAALFLAAAVALLAFAGLEQRTSLGPLSDRFREVAYGSTYQNEERDVELLGRVRPKAFTQEPSFGSRGVAVLLLIGALLWKGPWVGIGALLGMAGAVMIFGSPIPAGFAVAMLYGLWLPRFAQSRGGLLVFQGGMTVAAAGFLGLLIAVTPVLQRRVAKVLDASDPSTYERTLFMAELAIKAMTLNPVSGVGLGGEEQLQTDFNMPSYAYIKDRPINVLINNAMMSVPFFGGLMGTLLFAACVWWALRRLPLRYRVVFLLTLFLMLNTTGSIHSSSAWLVGAILLAALGNDGARAAPPAHLRAESLAGA